MWLPASPTQPALERVLNTDLLNSLYKFRNKNNPEHQCLAQSRAENKLGNALGGCKKHCGWEIETTHEGECLEQSPKK